MKLSTVVCAALVAFGLASAAEASTIRYELTGTGTGTIGNTAFNNANLDMVALGDTDNVAAITKNGVTFYANPFSKFTITIGGVGTATILDISELLVFPQPVPGFITEPLAIFGRTDNPPNLDGITGIGFNFGNPLAGYTAKTAIGPITESGTFGFIQGCSTPGHDPCIHTSLGLLSFSSNPNTPEEVTTQTTFTATTTPEPATLVLLGTGVAALVRARTRRRESEKD